MREMYSKRKKCKRLNVKYKKIIIFNPTLCFVPTRPVLKFGN